MRLVLGSIYLRWCLRRFISVKDLAFYLGLVDGLNIATELDAVFGLSVTIRAFGTVCLLFTREEVVDMPFADKLVAALLGFVYIGGRLNSSCVKISF